MLTKLVEIIVAALLKYLGKAVPAMLKDYSDKLKREKEQAEAKKKLDAVVADPNATAAERAKEYENLINSGN